MYTTRRGRYLISCPTVRTSQTSSLPSYNILAQNANLDKGFLGEFFGGLRFRDILGLIRFVSIAATEGGEIQRSLLLAAAGKHLGHEDVERTAAAFWRLDPDSPAMLGDDVFADG